MWYQAIALGFLFVQQNDVGCINQILASQDDATMKAGFMKLLEED